MASQADTSVIHAQCKLCNNDIHLGSMTLWAIECHYRGKNISQDRNNHHQFGNTNLINSYLRPTAALIDTRTSSTSEQLVIIDVAASSSPNDLTSTTIYQHLSTM